MKSRTEPGLTPSLLIHVPVEDRPIVAAACLDAAEYLRLRAWIDSHPRIRELVELAEALEREGLG